MAKHRPWEKGGGDNSALKYTQKANDSSFDSFLANRLHVYNYIL